MSKRVRTHNKLLFVEKARKRKALITGGTGFIGSHLAKRLVRERWEVYTIVRPDFDKDLVKKLPAEVIQCNFDGKLASLKNIMKDVKPDIVFHLAALVIADQHRPEEFEPLIQSNFLFGCQMLEAMLFAGVGNIINTGSFFQHYSGRGYDPVNLYAATKQAFEDVLKYYVEVRSFRAITLKLFDVYGPEDTRKKIFNFLEEASKTGKTLLMSPGRQKLDLVYIDDVIDAYLHAVKLLGSSKHCKEEFGYAVSSGVRMELKQVVKLYEKILQKSISVKWGGRPYRAREVNVPWVGRPLPGWKAKVKLNDGLQYLS